MLRWLKWTKRYNPALHSDAKGFRSLPLPPPFCAGELVVRRAWNAVYNLKIFLCSPQIFWKEVYWKLWCINGYSFAESPGECMKKKTADRRHREKGSENAHCEWYGVADTRLREEPEKAPDLLSDWTPCMKKNGGGSSDIVKKGLKNAHREWYRFADTRLKEEPEKTPDLLSGWSPSMKKTAARRHFEKRSGCVIKKYANCFSKIRLTRRWTRTQKGSGRYASSTLLRRLA